MSEATMMLEIPVRVYQALQQLAVKKQSDPVSVLEQMLDVEPLDDQADLKPKNKLQELLLHGPTFTDEELAEFERVRKWMNEWQIPEL